MKTPATLRQTTDTTSVSVVFFVRIAHARNLRRVGICKKNRQTGSGFPKNVSLYMQGHNTIPRIMYE